MIKNININENFGVWSKTNGLEWSQDFQWKCKEQPNKAKNPLYTLARSEKHSLQLEFEDFIQSNQNIYLKKITLYNDSKEKQDFSLFFEQDFDHHDGTAFFSLSNRTLYHEYEGYYMLFNGLVDEKGISQYSTWQKNDFLNKSLINVENGSLFYNPISAGSVKSAFSLETTLLPYEIKHGYYWTVFGKNLHEIDRLNELVRSNPEWQVRLFIDNVGSSEKIIRLSN